LSVATSESIQHYLHEQRVRVDAELNLLVPAAETYPPSIHQAMRHSVFAGGKRLRPILCMESGRLFGGDEAGLLRLGGALELIHTYSLIHDDLPAIDNDDLRRGKPTCHRAFGEATAILAGDALLTLAFEVLSAPGPNGAAGTENARRLRVIHEVARAIGTVNGMVGGQVVDIESAGKEAGETTLDYIHSSKTGALIRGSVRSSAILADAPEDGLALVTTYAEKVGLAFQIADDLLDVHGSSESLGKTPGKDGREKKLTYPAIHGLEESARVARRLVREACDALDSFGPRAQRLREIAEYLIARSC
jgi:geranylgeranyl diphosphate synthase, type II